MARRGEHDLSRVLIARAALELLLARRAAVEEVRLLLDEVAAHALRLCTARVQDRVSLRVDDRLAQLEGARRLRALGVRALEAEAAGDAARAEDAQTKNDRDALRRAYDEFLRASKADKKM